MSNLDDSNAVRQRAWRREFPYRLDDNELVSRRTLLRFAVYTSGALFAGTALLTALNAFTTRVRGAPAPIRGAEGLAAGEALYFAYPNPDDQAMLIHLPDGRFVAYSQKCTHLSCAVYYQPEHGRIFCPCHEGVFDPQTGEPIAGPPQRRLAQIELRQEGGRLIAVREVP
jgi:nitrite reductase/ring-hydroxylating ferredoxin subunit